MGGGGGGMGMMSVPPLRRSAETQASGKRPVFNNASLKRSAGKKKRVLR
jgi:hypothetical protein